MRISICILVCLLMGCDSKPKVIVADSNTQESSSQNAPAQQDPSAGQMPADLHQVVATEVLNTERYTYLKAREGAEEFWVAVPRQEIKVGNTYYYRGGLKKTNFYSQEFDRNFDLVYLVSNIMDAQNHPGSQTDVETNASPEAMKPEATATSAPAPKDAIKLSDLLGHPEKYQNKKVTVSGQLVKANYQIMGKNWYHLQDGSQFSGKKADLTITSQQEAQLGERLSFQGTIYLKKDFGAGYKYDLIMEEAVILR